MNQHSLPPIFAVYRPESNTFSLFEPDVTLNSVLHRIVPWYRPVKSCWRFWTDKERIYMRSWFEGQRWYIVKNNEESKELYDIVIQKKSYKVWSLNHSLVWAKSRLDDYDSCPTVPILEFNSQKLVSSEKPGFQVVWNAVHHEDLLEESGIGWGLLFDRINAESGSEKPLRICTPKPKASDSDQEQEEDTFNIPVEPSTWIDTLKSWIGIGLYSCTAATLITVYATIIRTVIGI
jgi:hypothetical protein